MATEASVCARIFILSPAISPFDKLRVRTSNSVLMLSLSKHESNEIHYVNAFSAACTTSWAVFHTMRFHFGVSG